MTMEPFTAYTLEGEENTFGYTIFFPVEVLSRRIFIGWKFFLGDTGRVEEYHSFGRKALALSDAKEIAEYSRWRLTERVSQEALRHMIKEIFEYYRGEHG